MNEEANANANSLKMLAKLQNRLRGGGGMLEKRMKLWVMCNRAGTRYGVIVFSIVLKCEARIRHTVPFSLILSRASYLGHTRRI